MSAAFNLPSDPGRIEQLETTIAAEVKQIDDLQRENDRLEHRNADLAERLVAAETQRDKARDLLEVKERQALAHADENATLKRELDDALKENARVKADLTRCLRLLGQGLDLADTWRGTCEWAEAVHTSLTHLPDGDQ
ncbi:hypothetical protein [Rhodococcus sp. AH-ZY2]|uniref:hypothetical protein n=1 Tax=Rhodococcus sp. AH-ZY2 TaxID=3047468 RepID=UPI0027DFBAF5|nr:hypothetical protein [Rhodococcus sp. AH-ZY2]WML63632.1 hypothetical protein QNA09_02100 [Rhodococcus sp. AH-ZY2]